MCFQHIFKYICIKKDLALKNLRKLIFLLKKETRSNCNIAWIFIIEKQFSIFINIFLYFGLCKSEGAISGLNSL